MRGSSDAIQSNNNSRVRAKEQHSVMPPPTNNGKQQQGISNLMGKSSTDNNTQRKRGRSGGPQQRRQQTTSTTTSDQHCRPNPSINSPPPPSLNTANNNNNNDVGPIPSSATTRHSFHSNGIPTDSRGIPLSKSYGELQNAVNKEVDTHQAAEGSSKKNTKTNNNSGNNKRNHRRQTISIEKNMYTTNNNNKGGGKSGIGMKRNSHSYGNALNMITMSSDMETVNTGMDTRLVDNSRKATLNKKKNDEFDIPTLISAEGGGSRHTFTMSKSNKMDGPTNNEEIRRTFDLGKSNKNNPGLLGSSSDNTPPPRGQQQMKKRRSSLGVSGNVYRQVMEKSPVRSRGNSLGKRRSTLAVEQVEIYSSKVKPFDQGGSSSGGGAKRRSSLGISGNTTFREAMERHSSTAAVYGGDKNTNKQQQTGGKKMMKKKKSDEGWKDMKLMSVQELMNELKVVHGINIDGSYEKADLMGACAQARRTHKSGGIGIQAAMRSSSTQQKKSMKRAKSLDGGNDRSESTGGGGGGEKSRYELKRGKSLDSSNQAAAAAYLSDNSGHSRSSLFNRRRRRRRTNDTNSSNNFNNSGASGLDYSANPQQGYHLVETNFGDGPSRKPPPGGMGGPRRRTTQASSRSRSIDRRNSKDMSCGSSLSSAALGLDIDDNNLDGAILNVPLGVGLSSAARDAQNPNQQMASLLQQMQVLEEQQVTRGQLNKSSQQQQRRRSRSRSRRRTGDSYHNSEYNKSGASTSGSSWYAGSQHHDIDAYMSGASSYGGGMMDRSMRSNKSAATDMKEYLMTSGTTASQHNNSYTGSRRPTFASSGGGSVRDLYNASDANLKFDDEDSVKDVTLPSSDTTGTTNKRSGRAWKKKQPSKKNICIGLVFFLIVAGGLAAGLWFGLYHEGDLFGNDNGSVATTSAPDRTGQDNNNSTSIQKYVVDPPLDIEGRCSPANLPGSSSACYEACLPAMCCYPSSRGPSCLNVNDKMSVEACRRYRPYCDVILGEDWPGREYGVLRTPPSNVVQMCMEINATKEEENVQSSNNTTSGVIARKRLRGHHENDATDDDHQRRLISDTPEQVCEQHCKSARCCHAPGSTGLNLSSSGVYTDTDGNHVVTNCLEANAEPCSLYEQFCNFSSDSDENDTSKLSLTFTWTSSPTSVPSNVPTESSSSQDSETASPSSDVLSNQTLSPSGDGLLLDKESEADLAQKDTESQPTPSPTSSLSPTQVKPILLPAPSFEIAEACSGSENEEMILAGMLNARTKCIAACQKGLCCYSSIFGYSSWMSSCFVGNEEVCSQYSPCLILAGKVVDMDSTATESNSTLSENNSTISENNTTVVGNQTSPQEDITSTPSSSPTDDQLTLNPTLTPSEVQLSFTPTSIPTDGDTSAEMINNNTALSNTTVISEVPLLPEEDLNTLCSLDEITSLSSLKACESACQPGACCPSLQDGDSSCTNGDACEAYQPCVKVATMYDGLFSLSVENCCGGSQSSATVTEDEEQEPEPSSLEEDSSQGIPTALEEQAAPDNLATVCSFESLSSINIIDKQECYDLCQTIPDYCLVDGITSDSSLNEICETYRPCDNINLLLPTPSNLDESCSDPLSAQCEKICSKISCCFANGQTSPSCYS